MNFILAAGVVACDGSKSTDNKVEKAEASPAVQKEEASEDGQKAKEEPSEAKAEPTEEAQKTESGQEADKAQKSAERPGANGESAKRKDIRKLLEATGSAKLGLQVVDQMISTFKRTAPNVPEKFWDEFRKDISEKKLVDLIVPIYDKHLTHEEIKALLAFFNTEAGKSYVKKLPVITRESQIAGQKWGRDIALKVQKRLQEKGYK